MQTFHVENQAHLSDLISSFKGFFTMLDLILISLVEMKVYDLNFVRNKLLFGKVPKQYKVYLAYLLLQKY